jgi:hypothetical protein
LKRWEKHRLMDVLHVTPKVLADLFKTLSHEDQKEVLNRLDLNAEAIFLLVSKLHPAERNRFSEKVFQSITWRIFPWLIRLAKQVVKQNPQAGDEDLDRLINEEAKKSLEEYEAKFVELSLSQFKEARDPKPRNIERDDEIVRLRDEEDQSFGEIPRLLVRKNPSWRRKNGKPLTRDAVERVYRRRKGLGTE